MFQFSRLIPQCRHCITETQLEVFQANFQYYAGNPVEMDYLKDENTHAVAVYWRGDMLGGYVLRQGPELRYRDILIRAGGVWPESPQASDCAELCCSWLARRHTLLSAFMFCDSAKRLQALPQSFLVGGSRIPAVVAAHSPFFPHSICTATRETQGRIERWSFYYTEAERFTPGSIVREALRRFGRTPFKALAARSRKSEKPLRFS